MEESNSEWQREKLRSVKLTLESKELGDFINLRNDYTRAAVRCFSRHDGIRILDGLLSGYSKAKHIFNTNPNPDGFLKTLKHWMAVTLNRHGKSQPDIYDIGCHLAGQDIIYYYFSGKPLFPTHDIVSILMDIERQGLVDATHQALRKEVTVEDLL